jgi:hypothetical protein
MVPHYSNESGVGVMFAYTVQGKLTFVGNISSEESAFAGISANHSAGKGKWHLYYDAFYYASNPYTWGIGYMNAGVGANRREYSKKSLVIKGKGLYRVNDAFSAGPLVGYEQIEWEGMASSKAFTYGAEGRIDTRNSAVSTTHGFYVLIRQNNYTDFKLKPYYGTAVQIDLYREIWDGGVLASDLYGEFTYGAVPVTMLPSIGGTDRMRGYYRGRYRDNNALSYQVELRQSIGEFFGVAGWIGAANVWGKANGFNIGHTLPNAGVGIRWRMQGSTSLRLDFGVGKDGQNGFVFGLNEAF